MEIVFIGIKMNTMSVLNKRTDRYNLAYPYLI